MSAALFLITLHVLGAVPARAPMVFGRPEGWVVLSAEGKVLRQLSAEICGLRPVDLAVSSDLKTFVLTAWSTEKQTNLLYACDGETGAPRPIGDPTGYHGGPSLTADGKWIYFVHHPKKGGPPGAHEVGANAQLYRVHSDGTGLEAMTDSKGCKLSPRPAGDDTVVLVHATCTGPRTVELMRLKDKRVLATWAEKELSNYPDLSPDGRRLLWTLAKFSEVELLELDVKTGQSQLLAKLGPGQLNTHARWSADGKTAFFQKGAAVWKVTRGPKPVAEQVVVIGGAT